MSAPSSADRYAVAAHVTQRRSNAPAAGTVLLLHGLGGDTTQFDPFLPHLARLPYDLLLPDMRAHGRTALTGDPHEFTFRQLAADIKALLAGRDVQQPVIGVGISMGAGVLAALAVHEPHTFAGLVVIRPAWEDRPDPDNLRPFRAIADLLGTRDSTAAAAEFARSQTYQAVRAESPTAADSLMDQFSAPHAAQRRLRLARMPLSTPFTRLADLRRIPAPIAVIGTHRDPLHPLSVARHWADSCGTTQHVVPPKSADDNRYITESAAIVAALADRVRDIRSF